MTINGILKIVAGLGLVITLAIFAFSGTTIKPGEEGTLFDSFGGGMETEMVYTEGYVPHLPWKEMIVYNVQNKAYKYQAKVLDKDGTEITVFVTVSASVKRGRSPFIHLKHGIGYEKSVIDERIAGAIKDVIGKYGYEQIYGAMRDKLEGEIDALVRKSLGKEDILVAFTEVKDVNLPEDIQSAIIAKQTQDQLNLKAEKLKVYEDNIASANVASAKGRYDAAEYDAKTKAIMSQPKMLALKQLEIEQIWAEKGVSPYGTNNVFGAGTTVVKGLK
jgi:regulator of protease activity HflC (stomatin/prohibitin superfamily)